MTRQRVYNTYRQMFPEFIYESFAYDVQADGLHISFSFRMREVGGGEGVVFEPSAFIPSRSFLCAERLSKGSLDTLVFNIGMVELVSYWKAYCPPVVTVRPFRLTDQQVAFWKKLYFNGLGEFFYTNGISADIDTFMTIRSEGETCFAALGDEALEAAGAEGHIVPVGGGKDSVVTLELLGGSGSGASTPMPLIMNPRGATTECVRVAGYSMDDVAVIKRTIHPKLLDLNKKGALNGHTPFSAMLAFYTLLVAAMSGRHPNIALSNESSANESTVAGTSVNHQYSKSLEFEDDFREYVRDNISPAINYYSFLRPLSELQIAMLFATFTKYHPVFRSCNVGSKEDVWCGHCAKCLFAYIILSPFIEPDSLNAIFGKNMLDDSSLRHEFEQLTGKAETKPFECVGTVDEVNSALSMTIAKWYPSARPALLEDYVAQPVVTRLDTIFDDHNVPADDLASLKSALRIGCGEPSARNAGVEMLFRYRELFNILYDKHILIAGYGREGKSTHNLLTRMFPARQFDVAKDNDEICRMLRLDTYDLVFKSPGIPMSVFDRLCDRDVISSQSDIFLRVYHDITIGVTGTKGKSTTTSLLYNALRNKTNPGNVVLAGNIGIPFFDVLEQLDASSHVVAELSCHQLENIHVAPHIAVILNLFEEHLDHYNGYEDYCMAKMQIALRQGVGDSVYYCSDNDDLRRMFERYGDSILSRRSSYDEVAARGSRVADLQPNPLCGIHNLCNEYVAMLVAGECGVDSADYMEMLKGFKGLEHRLEYVATKGGVEYYNDSISTIPQATIAAVKALGRVETLILGGFSRGIDYSPLAEFLGTTECGKAVRNIVLFGSAGREIAEAFSVGGWGLPGNDRLLRHYDTDYSMSEAVGFAKAVTGRGRICLLSPAASSYDRYKNFEERGNDYKRCVNIL